MRGDTCLCASMAATPLVCLCECVWMCMYFVRFRVCVLAICGLHVSMIFQLYIKVYAIGFLDLFNEKIKLFYWNITKRHLVYSIILALLLIFQIHLKVCAIVFLVVFKEKIKFLYLNITNGRLLISTRVYDESDRRWVTGGTTHFNHGGLWSSHVKVQLGWDTIYTYNWS